MLDAEGDAFFSFGNGCFKPTAVFFALLDSETFYAAHFFLEAPSVSAGEDWGFCNRSCHDSYFSAKLRQIIGMAKCFVKKNYSRNY